MRLRARERARDHHTSSTLVGGNGGAGPSSLHTPLKGPMEYVNARWIPTWHRMDHVNLMVTWTLFKSHLLEVGLT